MGMNTSAETNNGRKGINLWVLIPLCLLGLIVVVALVCWGKYTKTFDEGTGYETSITAAWENNENILAQFKLKIADAVGVSKMNASQVEQLIVKANEARYGANGSQAVMQWLQEQNIQLDQSINKRLVQIIEAGRDDFRAAQTRMIDTKRSYEQALKRTYFLGSGWWLELAGFPTIDLAEYKIISSGGAREAFEKGVDKPMTF